MQGTVSKYCVALKRKQRKWLERVVRRRTPSHWLVQRARAILLGAEGQSIQSICQQLSMDRQVVRRWRKRFLIGGVHSLKDRPRPGRPPVIGAKVWQKCRDGCGAAADEVRSRASALEPAGTLPVPQQAVRLEGEPLVVEPLPAVHGAQTAQDQVLAEPDGPRLRPEWPRSFASSTWIHRLAPCCSASTRSRVVQAQSRKHPTIPMARGRPARVEFEYKRHGTRNVFAAFNVRTETGAGRSHCRPQGCRG